MSPSPNFIIIGAPKCGTTAMSEYLRTHPNVFMSNPKEPAFFAEDVAPIGFRTPTLDAYLHLFANATPEQVVVSEASTFYIHSGHAVERIRAFNPDIKLMAMLRRPTDLVYSYHGELLRNGRENIWDFETAWGLQPERAVGKAVPPGARPSELNYIWIGSLGSQVDRVLKLFPRNQVHFILYDDFVKDTRAEYCRLLDFLEIPDDGKTEFPRVNEGAQYKVRTLARLPRYVRGKLGIDRLTAIKKTIGIRRLGIIRAFDKFNAEARPRPPLRAEFRRHLDEVFDEEVVLLQKLLGVDLSKWRASSTSSQHGRLNIEPTASLSQSHN